MDSVLDVGCGDGTFCRFVARDGRRVVGLDIDASAFPADAAGAGYVVASAEDLPFADGTFGVVAMTMVLHHVHAERALAEAARVLAPGGVLLILGYGRYGGWRDAPYEVRDLLTHRLVSRGMRSWDPPTAKAEPSGTWSQARTTARDALPGSSYRLVMARASYAGARMRRDGLRLELEVEAQGIVELSHQVGGNPAHHCAQPFDGHGSDLFGFRLGVDSKPRLVG